MWHVTKYCNVVIPHCTVQWNTTCIQTLPFLEVGQACEASLIHIASSFPGLFPNPHSHDPS